MQRACFRLRVRRDRRDEYRERHQDVWPEMLTALRASGWRNYSLFLAPDGLVVGYLEAENFERARAAMAATDVNRRWQASVADLFEPAAPGSEAGLELLEEVFHLD
ncbi:MAG: L-rhamnose mutarotase [Solirubrobacteraceae bacterium]